MVSEELSVVSFLF